MTFRTELHGGGWAATEAACQRAAARMGVPLEIIQEKDFRPILVKSQEELLVVGHGELAEDRIPPIVLGCPVTHGWLSRSLIIHPCGAPLVGLATIGEICTKLDTSILVLILATSEAEARDAQNAAQSYLISQGITADLDYYVGRRSSDWVAHVASLRHCQLVISGRPDSPSDRSFIRQWSTFFSPRSPFAFLTLPMAACLQERLVPQS